MYYAKSVSGLVLSRFSRMPKNTCAILYTEHADLKFKFEEIVESELLTFDCKNKEQLKKKKRLTYKKDITANFLHLGYIPF